MEKLKFNVLDKVLIIPLDNVEGIIINIWITIGEIQYKVRYFIKDEIKEVYYYDYELKIFEKNITRQIGFKSNEN